MYKALSKAELGRVANDVLGQARGQLWYSNQVQASPKVKNRVAPQNGHNVIQFSFAIIDKNMFILRNYFLMNIWSLFYSPALYFILLY